VEQQENIAAMTSTPLAGERLRAALDALAAIDPDVARELARIGYPPARQRDPGFATLVRIVAAQQVSTASAAAVWNRLELALAGEISPERLLALGEAGLRAAGFSGRKAGYALGLAAAVAAGELDLPGLPLLDEDAAIERIVRLRGFGRWSAEIYLLFALGRADTFPADDLAVQIAFQRLKRLEARPTAKALRVLAEPWRPFRGAGAVFLWHCYGASTLDEARTA
jgi:DNA-3-methyladenine glycosylase II